MSDKPLQAINSAILKRKLKYEVSAQRNFPLLPPPTIIFSEGVKTEFYYMKGLADRVNAFYDDYTVNPRIQVVGTGRNTRSLLQYARAYIRRYAPNTQEVWLMYDKDDFPADVFDNTQFSAEKKTVETGKPERNYHVAWSNECIELWFVLHFQDLQANVSREQYQRILKRYFPYQKNMTDLYQRLQDRTDQAITRSKRLLSSYGDRAPSQCCPATRVHELVEQLKAYLPAGY